MTVEVMPVGERCALACRMCFQNPIRAAGNAGRGDYDLEEMKKALSIENYHFTLFGGEPLLMPIEDLTKLWAWGLEKYGQNGIQTSASCIREEHFELFKKYNVSVGLSLEGPGALNDIRWAGSLERTRKTTAQVEAVLYRLIDTGRPPSLITTFNRGNAAPDRLPRLLEWFRELDRRGLRHINLHLMEIDDPELRGRWTLTAEENAAALLACADLQSELEIAFMPISDMVGLLLGTDEKSSCVWNACDPLTTRAVRGISAHGERINCSRSNKAGVEMIKADRELLVRPIALYHTDQAAGGCSGCRFWFACKGSCPGEAMGGDWRRRTEHCQTLKMVFSELEDRLGALGFKPISRNERRRRTVETALLEAYEAGRPIRISEIGAQGAKCSSSNGHGDGHGDIPHGDGHADGHGDHGDSPHGDRGHGDHTDASNPVKSGGS